MTIKEPPKLTYIEDFKRTPDVPHRLQGSVKSCSKQKCEESCHEPIETLMTREEEERML